MFDIDHFTQGIEHNVLYARIQRQHHVLSWHSDVHYAFVFNHVADAITNHAARTHLAFNGFVVCPFNRVLTFTFNVGETRQMCKHIALRVIALHFFLRVHTGDIHFFDFIGDLLIDLAVQIHEAFVVFCQFFIDVRDRHVQQFGQIRLLRRRHCDLLRDDPNRPCRHIGSQNQHVAVINFAARCGDFEQTRVPRFAFCLQKIIADELQPHRPQRQNRHCEHDQRQQKT